MPTGYPPGIRGNSFIEKTRQFLGLVKPHKLAIIGMNLMAVVADYAI